MLLLGSPTDCRRNQAEFRPSRSSTGPWSRVWNAASSAPPDRHSPLTSWPTPCPPQRRIRVPIGSLASSPSSPKPSTPASLPIVLQRSPSAVRLPPCPGC